jgi:hypothetical protein
MVGRSGEDCIMAAAPISEFLVYLVVSNFYWFRNPHDWHE